MANETLDAVKKAVESSKERKFVESIEISFNLKDVDLKNPKNRINEEMILPNGRGKEVKIGIFATAELAEKAKGVVDLLIKADELDDFASNKIKAKRAVNEIEFFIAEAPLMPTIGKTLGVILGPRGKMPKPVPPNIDPASMVKNLKNTVRIRSRDRRTFQVPVGTKDMALKDIAQNIDAVISRVESRLERGRNNINSAYVKTTMGPSVRLI